MSLTYSWAFTAQGVEAPPIQGSGVPVPPENGTESIPVAKNSSNAYEELANRLDESRARLNEIVTCWKDAVGIEPDSSQGRSNQASKSNADGSLDDGGNEEEEDDDDDDEEEEVDRKTGDSTM